METIKLKMYVSLPISGYDLDERKKFARCAGIREASKFVDRCHGEQVEIMVITPFHVCPETDLTYAEYIGRDITSLMGCDRIVMCAGWEKSKGCRIEKFVAETMGIEVVYSDFN